MLKLKNGCAPRGVAGKRTEKQAVDEADSRGKLSGPAFDTVNTADVKHTISYRSRHIHKLRDKCHKYPAQQGCCESTTMKMVQSLSPALLDGGGHLLRGRHYHFRLPTMMHTRDTLECIFVHFA